MEKDMQIWQTQQIKSDSNSGYISIHDDGFLAERRLFIKDDNGNTVCLKNEQIGELYKQIKPAMAG
jgi:hypothetical protein